MKKMILIGKVMSTLLLTACWADKPETTLPESDTQKSAIESSITEPISGMPISKAELTLEDFSHIQNIKFLDENTLAVFYPLNTTGENMVAVYDTASEEIIENKPYEDLPCLQELLPTSPSQPFLVWRDTPSPDGEYYIRLNEVTRKEYEWDSPREEKIAAYNEAADKLGIPYGVISFYDSTSDELLYRSDVFGEPPGTIISLRMFLDDDTALFTVSDGNPIWGAYYHGVVILSRDGKTNLKYPPYGDWIAIQK